MQTRPDVLALCAPPPTRALLIGDARRLDIPCIGTGLMLRLFDIPTVHEDGEQGARLAVEHLISKGHRRIAWVSTSFVNPFVWNRRCGWQQAMQNAGLEPDARLTFWVDEPEFSDTNVERLERFLDREQPTALAFANFGAMQPLRTLIQRGKVRVPKDLSTVNLDQSPDVSEWLGGLQPTHVSIPLKEMGQELARMGRRIIEEQTIEPSIALPCRLHEGESVQSRSN
jgi:DNA-binding LacI/PurR family transcriptional regulator